MTFVDVDVLKEIKEELLQNARVAAGFSPAYVTAMKEAVQIVDRYLDDIKSAANWQREDSQKAAGE